MRLTSKLVKNLTHEEMLACKRLSFPDGLMRENLVARGANRAVMLYDGDKLIGWSLIHYNYRTPELYVYVRATERKRGHGRRLVNKALKYTERPVVYPADPAAGGVFRKFKQDVKYPREYEKYL